MQLFPCLAHLPTNTLINQKLVGLVLILLAVHQRFVFQAVILNVCARDDMVDLVLTRARHKLIKVDSATRVQALSVLHQIEGQTLVKVNVCCFELLKVRHNSQVSAFGLKGLEGILNGVPAFRGPFALLLFVLVTSHLDKYVCRRMSCNLRDLINNTNRLIQAATNRRGSGELIYAERLLIFGIVFAIVLIHFFLEAQRIVVENLHHHHGLAQTTLRAGVSLAQHVHDAHRSTGLGVNSDARQELLRQTSPTGQALFANLLNLFGIEHSIAAWTKLILQFFLKD